MFTSGLLACAAAASVLVAGSYLVGGVPTALSAALGAAVATLFFALGLGALRLVLAGPGSMLMIGALAVYAVQVGLLFALVDALGAVSGLEGRPFALGGLVAVLAWQAAQVVVIMRRRTLVFDTPMPGDQAEATLR